MQTTKITPVAHLVEICVLHGLSKVVISPGSRNAPLIIAFDAHPAVQVYIVHDERSAAFFALGLAESSGQPVAICCTSGSAAINYAPAISEAYYRNIPLLVLTADRPIEWVDQGDGQTIRQKHLFANFIKADFDLPNSTIHADPSESNRIVNDALNNLKNVPQAPVHLNIPLVEPLYEMQELTSSPEITIKSNAVNKIGLDDQAYMKETWLASPRKLILIGQMPPDSLSQLALAPFLNDPATAILVENCSNFQDFQSICHCIDRTLEIIQPNELKKFQPDLLITLGGAIVSKKIKSFLRKFKPSTHWRVGEFLFEEDTFQALTRSFVCHPNHFFSLLGEIDLNPQTNYGNNWKQRDFMAQERHLSFLETAPFSDLKAFEFLLDTLPEKTNLHLGNSSVVRYAQLFNPASDIHYFSNRGVSGIDGSTSTALGIANQEKERLNVIISGDISFFYDSNALWNNYLPSNFRIIVINNGGGGIFKIIDGPSESAQNELFVAPYQAKIEPICEAFNVHYLYLDLVENMDKVLTDFYTIPDDNRPILLEINTQNIPNEEVLKNYFSFIKSGAVE